MVRTVIIPEKTDIHLTIPKEYVGKKIEITYLALDELGQEIPIKKTMADFSGVLSEADYQSLKEHKDKARN